MAKKIRLDKYLSDAEGLTRSQARQYIRAGRVSLNGQVQKKGDSKVDPDLDQVMVDGRQSVYEEYLYYMLNKPQGVISARSDPKEKTVIDLIDCRGHALFPVGRLDKDTEGLLLLTDDGDFAHRLLSPRKHVDKCYLAIVDKPLEEEDVLKVKEGLDIGDEKKTMPAHLVLEGPDPEGRGFTIRVTIQEGRYHQVKRMMEALGTKVLYLKRESMGRLKLDPELALGDYRPLRPEELALLI